MDSETKVWQQIWPPVTMLAIIVVAWDIIVRFELVYAWLIPSPFAVLTELVLGWDRLLEHWLATLQLTLLGFGGGAICGILLGAILHIIPILKRATYPVLVLSQNIPIIVIAPIITMLFGFGLMPKIFVIVLVCFFPVCIAMLSGLAQADQNLRNYMGMIGGSKWQQFIHLELPSSLPNMFSGLKIAASYSQQTPVQPDTKSPKVGLGGYMILSSRGYMPERVFAAVFLIVLTSLMMFWLMSWLEAVLLKWRPRKEGH